MTYCYDFCIAETVECDFSQCLQGFYDSWCRWSDSNRHDFLGSQDFKSCASAISPHRQPWMRNCPQPRRYSYQKAPDGRKQPIRGLWVRNGRYIAHITAEDSAGNRAAKWVPLGSNGAPVETVAQAKEAFRKLLTQRDEGKLPILKRTPKFAEFVETYFGRVQDKKRPATIDKERSALKLWVAHFGGIRIDKIRKSHVNDFIDKRLADGISGRTVNLDVIALRNLINRAIDDDWLKTSPLENLRPVDYESKTRSLVTQETLDKLCEAASETRVNEQGETVAVTKNARQFVDYIRLMAYCGSRRDETLRLKWGDVNWQLDQLTIGADGLSKNGEPRVVDFNPDLGCFFPE